MTTKKESIALAEFLYYLNNINPKYKEKIPKKMLDLFEQNCDKDYKCNFDYTKPYAELEVTYETKVLINLICYKYWCENNEQKEALRNKWKENTVKKENELREKYNPDNIFNNNKKDENEAKIERIDNQEELPVVQEEKESLFSRIISFFKNLFGRNKN